jgi:hypothetical protein
MVGPLLMMHKEIVIDELYDVSIVYINILGIKSIKLSYFQ